MMESHSKKAQIASDPTDNRLKRLEKTVDRLTEYLNITYAQLHRMTRELAELKGTDAQIDPTSTYLERHRKTISTIRKVSNKN